MKIVPLYNIHKMATVGTLVRRLRRLGIELELEANLPWIYLTHVDGQRVQERFLANHGFTVAILKPQCSVMTSELTDIKEIFKVVRKYNKSFIKPHI